MSKTAAVLLNYNSWEETLANISCLRRALSEEELEIIVIDNASPNESAKMLKNRSAELRYKFISAEKNLGYAAGNNIGLKLAFEKGYDYAWVMNSDIVIEDVKLTLSRLIEGFKKNSHIASVNPDIVDGAGHPYNRDAYRPSVWDMTLGMPFYKKKGRKIKSVGGYALVYRPQGCCMMLDLKKLSEVGFLDENTFLYMEELILAERFIRKGYRCVCCSDIKVIHHDGSTVKRSAPSKLIRKVRAESFRYYLENYREFNAIERWFCCRFDALKRFTLDKKRQLCRK